jgi:hypothetical protein
VLPVAAISFALHACAFHYGLQQQNVTLEQEAIPSLQYLWASLLMGAGLVAWMFAAFEWAGQYLVRIGLPIACIAGAVAPELKNRLCLCWQRRVYKLKHGCEALVSANPVDPDSSEPMHAQDTRDTDTNIFYTPVSATAE